MPTKRVLTYALTHRNAHNQISLHDIVVIDHQLVSYLINFRYLAGKISRCSYQFTWRGQLRRLVITTTTTTIVIFITPSSKRLFIVGMVLVAKAILLVGEQSSFSTLNAFANLLEQHHHHHHHHPYPLFRIQTIPAIHKLRPRYLNY